MRRFFLLGLVFGFMMPLISAQDNSECAIILSNVHTDTKAKKYDAAYEPWLYVKTNCPNLSLAIYADGEKILKHKIDASEGTEKLNFVKALLALWKDRKHYFGDRTPKGEYAAKACQLMYNHKAALGESLETLYPCFDGAFKADQQTFRHPKSLYTYFSLMVELFDAGQQTAAELFNTYDNIDEKIQVEVQNYSERLNALIAKLDNGEQLSGRETKLKDAFESYLKNYALIKDNMDAIIDKKAECKHLIPLYTKSFKIHQNDTVWLKRAVNRLYQKQCTDSIFYETLVKQYDKVSPSADTKVFVATVLFKNDKDDEGFQYLKEAYTLETRPYQKSKLAFRVGVILKNENRFADARHYLLEALTLNPSNGKPHLIIAQMYANCAKHCGKDNFHKRAVFWLAAKEARKASRVDPTLEKLTNQFVSNYLAKAPTNEEIFLKGIGGQPLEIKCWINRTIIVPEPR